MVYYIQILCLSTLTHINQRNVSHNKLSKYCHIDAHLVVQAGFQSKSVVMCVLGPPLGGEFAQLPFNASYFVDFCRSNKNSWGNSEKVTSYLAMTKPQWK